MDILNRSKYPPNLKWAGLISALFFIVQISGDHVFNKTNTLKMALLYFVVTTLLIAHKASSIKRVQPKLFLILLLPVIATLPGLMMSQGKYSYSFPYELSGQVLCIAWCYLLASTPNAINSTKKISLIIIPVTFYVCIVGLFEKSGLSPLTRFNINPFETYWLQDPIIYQGTVSRIKSTFGNINYFASFLIQLVPILIALFYLHLQQPSKSNYTRVAARLFLFMVLIMAIACLFLTETRAAIFALTATFLVTLFGYLLNYKKRYIPFFVIGACILGILICVVVESDNRVGTLLNYEGWRSRVISWQAAINSIQAAPFFGYGLGSSYELFFNFMDVNSSIKIPNNSFNHAHSEPLEVLQEGGGLGLAIYLLFWGWLFILGIKYTIQKSNDRNTRIMVLAVLCGLLAYHVHGLFSVAPRMIAARMTAYTLVAFLLALTQEQLKIKPTNSNSKLSAALLIIGLVISTSWLIPYASSQYRYAKSLTESSPSNPTMRWTQTSRDIYTLYKVALTAAQLQQPDKLQRSASRLKELFPHFRNIDYLSSYSHFLISNLHIAQTEAKLIQLNNRYQIDTGILLSGLAIIEKNENEFKAQLTIAIQSLACKENLIDCDTAHIKTIVGDMYSPIQFIAKPEKITVFIDHSFLTEIRNKANLYSQSTDASINKLKLEYARLLGSSNFFRPESIATVKLTTKDHDTVVKYIKAKNFIKTSKQAQHKIYLSELMTSDSLFQQISIYHRINQQFTSKIYSANRDIDEAKQQILNKFDLDTFIKRRNLQLALASWLALTTEIAATQLDKTNVPSKMASDFKYPEHLKESM